MKFTLRIWILIICLIAAFFMITSTNSLFGKGALIKDIESNSSEFNAGLRAGMIITEFNSVKIDDAGGYLDAANSIVGETKIEIKTKDGGDFIYLTDRIPQITVSNIPKTKIKTGLDLSGGARALIRPENATLSNDQFDELIQLTSQRLNTFGLSDINIRAVSDLQGNKFMLVEVAGASPEDLRELVGKQGKFEAKIANQTVFFGGEKDIADVCRTDAKCAGIETCQQIQGGYACSFRFAVYLTQEAAERHAEITANIPLDETGQYLKEKLYLYLDDKEVDSLNVAADLRGRVTTDIVIQGPGTGDAQEDAYINAKASMNKLQTILLTGSLPYKLEIVKLDSISASLGKEFTRGLIYLGLFVFIAVSIAIFFKYRKIKLTLAVILTMLSEVALTLGIAAFIKWNLDAPGIAGIIAGIGTGVNDQIVLLDESSSGESSSLKERIKRAFFIIIGAFFTIVAAMIPLFWAGAGMLKGFALTTIIGVIMGVLITRPAFADIIKQIQE